MDYQTLKKDCRQACHDRHACRQGYSQMLSASSVTEMVAVWKDNISDIVGRRYSAMVNKHLHEYYKPMKTDFNRAGMYLNECPDNASSQDVIIVTEGTQPVMVKGRSIVYVIGKATVNAYEHAVVRLKHPDARANVYDSAICYAEKGYVAAYNFSTIYSYAHAECHHAARVTCLKGEITDYGHHQKLVCYAGTTVYTNHPETIDPQDSNVIIRPFQL